jgi:hypothetical protein
MQGLKLSKEKGWKPHVVSEILETEKHVIDKWMSQMFPNKKRNIYTTFEMLILYTILFFHKVETTDLDRLLSIEWQLILDNLIENGFEEIRDKTLIIDWKTSQIKIVCSQETLNEKDRSISFVKMEGLVTEIINCLLMKGVGDT